MIASAFDWAAMHTEPLTVAWLSTVVALGVIAACVLGWDAWTRKLTRRVKAGMASPVPSASASISAVTEEAADDRRVLGMSNRVGSTPTAPLRDWGRR